MKTKKASELIQGEEFRVGKQRNWRMVLKNIKNDNDSTLIVMTDCRQCTFPQDTEVEVKSSIHILLNEGVEMRRRMLGDNCFIQYGAESIQGAIFPSDWSVSQLRAIASYMERNRDCSIFTDGSGERVKL